MQTQTEQTRTVRYYGEPIFTLEAVATTPGWQWVSPDGETCNDIARPAPGWQPQGVALKIAGAEIACYTIGDFRPKVWLAEFPEAVQELASCPDIPSAIDAILAAARSLIAAERGGQIPQKLHWKFG